MCSVFGFIGRPGMAVHIKTLSRIVRENIHRGPHAFGFAWLDMHGRLRSYRQTGRLTDQLSLLTMMRGARLVVGHLRFATHGDARDNINNHPHPCDGGWLVHNGVIGNYGELSKRPRVNLSSECDSEALAQLIEKSAATTLPGRCARAINATDGPLTMLGLWSRPATLIAARRGNPLHFAAMTDGYYLATLADGLPGEPHSLKDNCLTRLRVRGGRIVTDARELDVTRGDLFSRVPMRGQYRGG